MNEQYLLNPIAFLIDTLLGLYILVLMLRFLLQLNHADFYNPISQFLIRAARPALQPLGRFVPSTTRVNGPSLVALLVMQSLVIGVVASLTGSLPGIGAVVALALIELIKLATNIYFFSIVIQAVMSWVSQTTHNPLTTIIHSFNAPLLNQAKRLMPPTAGIDLSPLVVLLGLQVAKMLLLPPLQALARTLA